MPDDTGTPDAVLIPEGWKGSGNLLQRADALFRHADRILGVEARKGEVAHVRTGLGEGRFATKSPHDTMFFPTNHPRSGQARYRWEEQPDGSRHGHYVDDEARDACPSTLKVPAGLRATPSGGTDVVI